MTGLLTLPSWRPGLRAIAGGLLLLIGAACSSGDEIGPSSESALPADSTAVPADSSAAPADSTTTPADSTVAPIDSTLLPPDPSLPPTDSAGINGIIINTSTHPGIVFGSFNMSSALISSVLNGTTQAVASTSGMMPVIVEVKAKGGRIVLKLSGGSQSHVKNADGTFSFTKWKEVVDRFRAVNLAPYITDGTIVGHYLIDEPNMAHRWGGKIIPQSTIEAMAKYSKQIWPTMPTIVRVVPTWLAAAPITYTYLDAGWAQYTAVKGDPTKWVTAEVTAAKAKGLGLVVSLNVLDGGNGSSGIPGVTSGKYSMSASELRSYGTALLNQSYTCAFYQWMYNSTYFGRSDIKSAMSEISTKARAHVKTSCKQ
ncbi:MAG: hypothetical protein ABI037_11775 [Gemmatimonadales bacterium]